MNNLFLSLTIFVFIICFQSSSVANENEKLKGKYLIVLDIQEVFTRKKMNSDSAINLLKAINRVIELTDTDKVIYMESILGKLVISLNGLQVEFEDGLHLDDHLNLVNENRFSKNKANAFTSEKFIQFIEKRNANDFVVVGLMAEHCVVETLIGGTELGYDMFFIPNAIAGESDKGKTESLERAIKSGAHEIVMDHLIYND